MAGLSLLLKDLCPRSCCIRICLFPHPWGPVRPHPAPRRGLRLQGGRRPRRPATPSAETPEQPPLLGVTPTRQSTLPSAPSLGTRGRTAFGVPVSGDTGTLFEDMHAGVWGEGPHAAVLPPLRHLAQPFGSGPVESSSLLRSSLPLVTPLRREIIHTREHKENSIIFLYYLGKKR